MCYHRGWSTLQSDDLGQLWEHFVLNELMAHLQSRGIRYWRDKRGHEVDFILARRGADPIATECKWSAGNEVPPSLLAFRKQYPQGQNFVVAADIDRSLSRKLGDLTVRFVNLSILISEIKRKTS